MNTTLDQEVDQRLIGAPEINHPTQHGSRTYRSNPARRLATIPTHNAVQGRFRQVDPMPRQDGLTDTAYSYAVAP